jgi:hypothetical protein
MKKQILGLGLALVCAATSAYADEIKLKFLNCTGKRVTINWTGYKVNLDQAADYEVIQGQFSLPTGVGILGGDKINDHTLQIFRSNTNGSTMDEHYFTMDFVQGVYGTVTLSFSQYLTDDRKYGNRIKLSSTNNNIYVPNNNFDVTPTTTPTLVADVRIGCQ